MYEHKNSQEEKVFEEKGNSKRLPRRARFRGKSEKGKRMKSRRLPPITSSVLVDSVAFVACLARNIQYVKVRLTTARRPLVVHASHLRVARTQGRGNDTIVRL